MKAGIIDTRTMEVRHPILIKDSEFKCSPQEQQLLMRKRIELNEGLESKPYESFSFGDECGVHAVLRAIGNDHAKNKALTMLQNRFSLHVARHIADLHKEKIAEMRNILGASDDKTRMLFGAAMAEVIELEACISADLDFKVRHLEELTKE